jgi:hypothetical protein
VTISLQVLEAVAATGKHALSDLADARETYAAVAAGVELVRRSLADSFDLVRQNLPQDADAKPDSEQPWILGALLALEDIAELRATSILNRFAMFATALNIARLTSECALLLEKGRMEKAICVRCEMARELVERPPQAAFSWGPVVALEKWAVIFESKHEGPIQVGVPAETIKRSMEVGRAVPSTFVLPPQLFTHANQNLAEIGNATPPPDPFSSTCSREQHC